MSVLSVEQNLSGFLASVQGLKLYKSISAVVRADLPFLKNGGVRLISGGGSGHEPAQVGYVGQGALTAAVCGNLFASPSVSNILSTIKLMGPAGNNTDVLLIVTNYTGDRLNFGLAAEMMRHEYNIKMLLVDDDCAIEQPRLSVGRRGLAGTVLVHKIAGAMAEIGKSLCEIYNYCSDILTQKRLKTIGFSFEVNENLLSADIGRGLHGEPGIEKVLNTSFQEIVKILLDKLSNSDREVILLFNNLGKF